MAKAAGVAAGIVAVLSALLSVVGLSGSSCDPSISACGLAILAPIGGATGILAAIVLAVGGVQMLRLDRRGVALVLFGMALGLVGSGLWITQVVIAGGGPGSWGGISIYFGAIQLVVYAVLCGLAVLSTAQ